MKEDNYTVKQLFDIVRKGMVWRGLSIEAKLDKNTTARMWLEEENITQGIFAVKSAAMHDNYVKWCKERGITGKSKLGIVDLGKYLTQRFRTTLINNSRHYYISKELAEDEEAKKQRQEKSYKHRAKKKAEENKKS